MFDPDLLIREPPVAPPQDETRRNLYVLGLPHDYTLLVCVPHDFALLLIFM